MLATAFLVPKTGIRTVGVLTRKFNKSSCTVQLSVRYAQLFEAAHK